MIPDGRRENVDILDCYMQQNLARNGGLLDEVIFLEHTENKADIAWLDELITKVPEYRKVGTPPGGWDLMWTALDQHDAIYVKIDDDLVSLTLPPLLHTFFATTILTPILRPGSTKTPSPVSCTPSSNTPTPTPCPPT